MAKLLKFKCLHAQLNIISTDADSIFNIDWYISWLLYIMHYWMYTADQKFGVRIIYNFF